MTDSVNEFRDAAKRLLKSAVTERTERDEQSMVGPSELGQPCDRCLGMALTRAYPEYRPQGTVLPPRSFSLKAWNGTAVHAALEKSLERRLQHMADKDFAARGCRVHLWIEEKLPIHHLEGYGTIHGHVDLILSVFDGEGNLVYLAVIDHKTTDKDKLKLYRADRVPDPYAFQVNLYGLGVHKARGRAPDDVGLHFIPRDLNDPDAIWVCFAPYRPEAAEMALDRAARVWSRVRAYELDSLESSPECFSCVNVC